MMTEHHDTYLKTAFFDTSLETLTEIPQKTLQNLVRLCGDRFYDLIYHLPTRNIDRTLVDQINIDQHLEQIISFEAIIGRHLPPFSARAPYRVIAHAQSLDGPIEIQLIFFNGQPRFLQNLLPINSTKIISGKLEIYDDKLKITHPDYVVAPNKKYELPQIQPIYPLSAGLTQRLVGKATKMVLDALPELPEWHRSDLIERYNWPNYHDAIRRCHEPEAIDDALPQSPIRQRLAFDALLAHQMTLAQSRSQRKALPAIKIIHENILIGKILEHIPFKLTGDQHKVIDEALSDLKKSEQMMRLIQGDVGSGKTIVALMIAAAAIESGAQVAMMVPTEILAKQHYQSLYPICEAANIRVAVLTGKDKASEAKKTLKSLQDGEIDLLIGTHSLIQERVEFKNLALAIIDEQHRFGVAQRETLVKKGAPYAHLLLMTATPIPRSLAMAHYGDCDLSMIKQKPPSRKPVKTSVMSAQKLDDIQDSLIRVIQQGGRAYWVCPLVEESEKIDLVAAEERFAYLNALYPHQVGLIHGKMKNLQKDAVMADFMSGKISILVATTVIEVGVNVPEATVMIIEEAERFGLSQLHQLRGRVGRGAAQASCVLIYKTLNPVAVERLSILRETEDGFLLAEKDLELRGAGDLLGTKQTGILSLPAFDYEHHAHFIQIARDDTKLILQTDPELTSPRGEALKLLMQIFKENRQRVS